MRAEMDLRTANDSELRFAGYVEGNRYSEGLLLTLSVRENLTLLQEITATTGFLNLGTGNIGHRAS
jgi:ABC-type sugar transport system ATPase subunit